MARRASGEGSVFRRKDGRWQASIQFEGKRRTVYGRTKAEAERKLAQLKQQAAGGIPDADKRTVADLFAVFLEAVQPILKPKTFADYRKLAERHILPTIGDVKLGKLDPGHLQRLYSGLQKQGKLRTAQLVHAVLHRAFELGVLWNWLSYNPADRVLKPSYRAKPRELWTREQLSHFLDESKDHWLYPLWLVAVTSGCRIGELLALTWHDVDFSTGTISISKSGQHIAGKWVVTEPKTRSGFRTLVLPSEAMAALRRQRARQLELKLKAGKDWHELDLVFSQKDGSPLYASDVAHAFSRQCRKLGLPSIGLHGFRHLHASCCSNRICL